MTWVPDGDTAPDQWFSIRPHNGFGEAESYAGGGCIAYGWMDMSIIGGGPTTDFFGEGVEDTVGTVGLQTAQWFANNWDTIEVESPPYWDGADQKCYVAWSFDIDNGYDIYDEWGTLDEYVYEPNS